MNPINPNLAYPSEPEPSYPINVTTVYVPTTIYETVFETGDPSSTPEPVGTSFGNVAFLISSMVVVSLVVLKRRKD